jgi:hypothetical protein
VARSGAVHRTVSIRVRLGPWGVLEAPNGVPAWIPPRHEGLPAAVRRDATTIRSKALRRRLAQVLAMRM